LAIGLLAIDVLAIDVLVDALDRVMRLGLFQCGIIPQLSLPRISQRTPWLGPDSAFLSGINFLRPMPASFAGSLLCLRKLDDAMTTIPILSEKIPPKMLFAFTTLSRSIHFKDFPFLMSHGRRTVAHLQQRSQPDSVGYTKRLVVRAGVVERSGRPIFGSDRRGSY
jgi:hypothetical protein